MIYFIIYTIIFILAHCAALYFFLIMIQEGQALDILLGWQKMLDKLYGSDKKWKYLLYKVLGGCTICTSFWSAPLVYIGYFTVTNNVGYWAVYGFTPNLVWLWVFWVTSACAAFTFVSNRLKEE